MSVSELADYSLSLMAVGITVGITTMAVLQMIMILLPFQRTFQRWWVLKWLRERAEEANDKRPQSYPNERVSFVSWIIAEDDLVRLATAGDRKAFYDLPIEQLCGQINVASQLALANGKQYYSLVSCLASLAGGHDIKRWVKFGDTGQPTQDNDDIVSVRNRVDHQVRRSIDSIQINAGIGWRRGAYQVSSVLLSAGLVVIISLSSSKPSTSSVAFIVLTAIIGGFFASVFRDLLAILLRR